MGIPQRAAVAFSLEKVPMDVEVLQATYWKIVPGKLWLSTCIPSGAKAH